MKTEGQQASKFYKQEPKLRWKTSCGERVLRLCSLTTNCSDSRSQILTSLGLLAQARATGEETPTDAEVLDGWRDESWVFQQHSLIGELDCGWSSHCKEFWPSFGGLSQSQHLHFQLAYTILRGQAFLLKGRVRVKPRQVCISFRCPVISNGGPSIPCSDPIFRKLRKEQEASILSAFECSCHSSNAPWWS